MSISIPFALLDGLAGSVLRYLSPTAPLNPSRTAFLGSKLCILSPQVLLNSLSGSISAFPSPNTAPVPHSKALPGSKPAFLSPQALSGAACSGCRSEAGARSTQCCRGQRQDAVLSSPSAPLVPPQGPAAPSLAAPPALRRGCQACPDPQTLRLAHRVSINCDIAKPAPAPLPAYRHAWAS